MSLEIEPPSLSDAIGIRLPNELKPEILTLMRVEDKKFGNLMISIFKQILPIKKKIYQQRNQLEEFQVPGYSIATKRASLSGDEAEYDQFPGLKIIISSTKTGDDLRTLILKKEDALILAANLHLFLNEVNL